MDRNQEGPARKRARKEPEDFAEADLKEAKRMEEGSGEEVVHSGKVVSGNGKEAGRKLNDLPSIEVFERNYSATCVRPRINKPRIHGKYRQGTGTRNIGLRQGKGCRR